MLCHIYLFRHGQTHFNRRKRFTGWVDSDWTTAGLRNANKTARQLKDRHIDVAFSSHLLRSKHTLHAVLKYHPECTVRFVDDRMIERCYGDLQMHSHAAFIHAYGQELYDKYHRAYDFPPPHGESMKMVEGRVRSFIHELLQFVKKYKVNVAISAHGNSMRPFRKYFEKATRKEMLEWDLPYDRAFEYRVRVADGPGAQLTKNSWKGIVLPHHVHHASDTRNVLKTYY